MLHYFIISPHSDLHAHQRRSHFYLSVMAADRGCVLIPPQNNETQNKLGIHSVHLNPREEDMISCYPCSA